METKLNINDKKGIFTALLTPFDKNNKINAKALEELIKFNVKMGVNGFYVTGSTGEAFLLSTEERKEVMDIVKVQLPTRCLSLTSDLSERRPQLSLANTQAS